MKIELKAGNALIGSSQTIKALGITIDNKLDWNPHINNLQRKYISMTAGLRIISRKLDKTQMLRVITSQVFSILLYASPVWLTTELSSKNLRKMDSMHYSALRLAVNM